MTNELSTPLLGYGSILVAETFGGVSPWGHFQGGLCRVRILHLGEEEKRGCASWRNKGICEGAG